MSDNNRGTNQRPSIFELSIKPGTLAVTSLTLGNVFKDFLAMSNPVAYSLGLLVGFLISYWIPPRIEMPFFKWLVLSVIVAMIIFILENMFGRVPPV
jgi:hypothetical protein